MRRRETAKIPSIAGVLLSVELGYAYWTSLLGAVVAKRPKCQADLWSLSINCNNAAQRRGRPVSAPDLQISAPGQTHRSAPTLLQLILKDSKSVPHSQCACEEIRIDQSTI